MGAGLLPPFARRGGERSPDRVREDPRAARSVRRTVQLQDVAVRGDPPDSLGAAAVGAVSPSAAGAVVRAERVQDRSQRRRTGGGAAGRGAAAKGARETTRPAARGAAPGLL